MLPIQLEAYECMIGSFGDGKTLGSSYESSFVFWLLLLIRRSSHTHLYYSYFNPYDLTDAEPVHLV